ncbi:MAG: sulfotransferase [Deinococcales bacterium]
MSNTLIPIFIRTPGRSGSTLIMEILASSEKVAFDRRYPFEVRHLSYLTRSAQVLARPYQPKKLRELPFNWGQSFFSDRHPTFIGPMPAKSNLFEEPEYFTALHKGLYSAFAEQILQKFPSARFYAEKVTVDDIIEYNKKITSCKTIYGMRDPRDQMVSIMSFNQKRGRFHFGWREDDTDVTFAKRFVKQVKNYLTSMIELQSGPEVFKLRYEDLIYHQDKVLTELSSWLGVTVNNSYVQKHEQKILAKHSTSQSATASVAKWRHELSPQVQAIFEEGLAKELMHFWGDL